jgi:hypothetical protein
MANKKIAFGKSYIPEAAPANVDNRLVYDFGKKYAVLEYKVNEVKNGAFTSAAISASQADSVLTLTTTFYNLDGNVLYTYSVDTPSTPVESVYLDYDNKKLVIETINGPDIEADLSELINKIIALEERATDIEGDIEQLFFETNVGTSSEAPTDARTWFEPVE